MNNNDRSHLVYELYNASGQSYGITTDIYMLPVGTEFRVENGYWNGKIAEDSDGAKCVYVDYTERIFKLSPDEDYKMVLCEVEYPGEQDEE